MKDPSRSEPDPGTAGDRDKVEWPKGRLLFQWSDHRVPVLPLGIFLVIALGAHLFGFYLFQVVYPVSGRVEPVPGRVRLLDPAQPAVSALMRQIDDRLVFLRPASSGADVRVDLRDYAVPFRPSFSGRELKFRRMPMPGDAAPGKEAPDSASPAASGEPEKKAAK